MDSMEIPQSWTKSLRPLIPANIAKLMNIDKTNFVTPSSPVQCCKQRQNNFW
jgi:hypothetical protein